MARMTDDQQHETTAGREADKPTDLPPKGWKAILKRVKVELKDDHVSLLAAGVAFKALLALFPAIVAAITIWGLIASPQEIARQLEGFTSALPRGAGELLNNQMQDVASRDSGTLSLALAISVALALWSASGGMAGLIEGCSAAYDEVDTRKFPIKRGIALLLTLGAIVFVLVTIGLIAVLPGVLDNLGLGSAAELAIQIGKWPLLAVIVMAGLAVVYKYGPHRNPPQLRWASWGAVIATILWLIGSGLFTLYVNNFGKFGETYGSFAGIIVLMLWLLMTAFVVLLGAEINAEMERQTAADTTVGEPEPMGARGAEPADSTPEDFRSPRA
jgi:membrane protein